MTDFYEQRIEALKQICLSHEEGYNKEFSGFLKENENMKTITDIPDNRSNLTFQTKETKDWKRDYDRMLKKNISLASLKSAGSGFSIHPIDEREEM